MRLTILNQFYRPDIAPTAYLAASLAEDRARRGDQVTVVASRGGYVAAANATDEKKTSPNPRIIRTWTPMLGKKTILHRCLDYLSYYVLAFLRVLFLPRQDVIISLTTPPYIVWVAICHQLLRRKCKIILWNMDCYPDAAERAGKLKHGGVISKLMRWANRAAFKRIDHLVVLDSAMRDLLLDQYAPSPDHPTTTIIPNWEDAAFFPFDKKYERWEGIDRLGLEGKFVVLYLGNMGQGHAFDQVIEAAKQLHEEPIVFLFIGGGARASEIDNARRENNLDNIIVHPYVPKEITGSVMAAASCALITLRPWAVGVMSPSKVHASLAAGLPILYVGPEGSNVDDAIKTFACGLSARHADTDKVVAFIRELAQDPQAHQALRDRSRAAFDQAYNDLQTLPQFEALLSEAVGSGG